MNLTITLKWIVVKTKCPHYYLTIPVHLNSSGCNSAILTPLRFFGSSHFTDNASLGFSLNQCPNQDSSQSQDNGFPANRL